MNLPRHDTPRRSAGRASSVCRPRNVPRSNSPSPHIHIHIPHIRKERRRVSTGATDSDTRSCAGTEVSVPEVCTDLQTKQFLHSNGLHHQLLRPRSKFRIPLHTSHIKDTFRYSTPRSSIVCVTSHTPEPGSEILHEDRDRTREATRPPKGAISVFHSRRQTTNYDSSDRAKRPVAPSVGLDSGRLDRRWWRQRRTESDPRWAGGASGPSLHASLPRSKMGCVFVFVFDSELMGACCAREPRGPPFCCPVWPGCTRYGQDGTGERERVVLVHCTERVARNPKPEGCGVPFVGLLPSSTSCAGGPWSRAM